MASLTACSAYDDLVGNDDAAVGSIAINADSGKEVDVTGEWHGDCSYEFFKSGYAKDVLVFAGTSVTVAVDNYGASDTTCSGTAPTREKETFIYNVVDASLTISDTFTNVTIGADKDVTWSASAPNSLLGPALSSTPTASTVALKNTYAEAAANYNYYGVLYVDDSDSENGNMVMYYDIDGSSTETYPGALLSGSPLTKQK